MLVIDRVCSQLNEKWHLIFLCFKDFLNEITVCMQQFVQEHVVLRRLVFLKKYIFKLITMKFILLDYFLIIMHYMHIMPEWFCYTVLYNLSFL